MAIQVEEMNISEQIDAAVRKYAPGFGTLFVFRSAHNGQAVFDLYAPDGSVTAARIVYFFFNATNQKLPDILNGGALGRAGVRELDNGWKLLAVEFSARQEQHGISGILDQAFTAL